MIKNKYSFRAIEKKWQDFWAENESFKVTERADIPPSKRKYILDMFPYPSGAGLHVGHPEGYTASDIYCRYLRHTGCHVLHPMGFDSFGLPSENYALKTGKHPNAFTQKNIGIFREQIKSFGFSYDWSREVVTSDKDYYRWTQWLFLQLYKKGLAYESEAPINWCPSCKTGLANEEVEAGLCNRCGNPVQRRKIKQWLLRITKYAQELLNDLEDLDWPESVKAMQRNWIGRSQGAELAFSVKDSSAEINIFTTRPDTLFGATYMVLAPEHPLVTELTSSVQASAVKAYIQEVSHKSDIERTDLNKDKSGVFTGSYAINPVNNAEIPIWIADYVLSSYGTGAIMAVPAHDERDWEFAQKFDLPIIEVMAGAKTTEQAFTGDGLHINSDFINGLAKAEAIRKITEWLVANNKGKETINYKLRDWLFSRQRYWGEPIPIIHCPNCSIVPVAPEELPVSLPDVETYMPSDTGESPLANAADWVNVDCPNCGSQAKRETNTMPQWAGSCWYYLRYLDPHNTRDFVSREKEEYWMPVDLYIGGAEHAVLHLLYARFWHKVLFDLGLVSNKEPFARLINQGMILGELEFTGFKIATKWISYLDLHQDKSRQWCDKLGRPAELCNLAAGEVEKLGENHVLRADKRIVIRAQAEKMSKSRGNVINPNDIIRDYGADTLRLYEMFMGPLQVVKPWTTGGLSGVHRFLNRVWTQAQKPLAQDSPPKELEQIIHKTIKKLSADIEKLSFNTAIAQMMVCLNKISSRPQNYPAIWQDFLVLLAPFAPHLAEELWAKLGYKESISKQAWPVWDRDLVVDDACEIVVQVNGKLRAKQNSALGLSPTELEELALSIPKIKDAVSAMNIIKIITIPDKLVNIVVKPKNRRT